VYVYNHGPQTGTCVLTYALAVLTFQSGIGRMATYCYHSQNLWYITSVTVIISQHFSFTSAMSLCSSTFQSIQSSLGLCRLSSFSSSLYSSTWCWKNTVHYHNKISRHSRWRHHAPRLDSDQSCLSLGEQKNYILHASLVSHVHASVRPGLWSAEWGLGWAGLGCVLGLGLGLTLWLVLNDVASRKPLDPSYAGWRGNMKI